MKKFISKLLVLTLCVLSLTGCFGSDNSSSGDGKVKLTIAHNQTSTDNPYQFGMLKFKEELEKLSNGSIEVEVHAGTIGTNEDELVEKLSLGAADMVLVSPGFMSKIGVKEVDFLSLPYLFDDYEHWSNAMDGEFGDRMKQVISEKTNGEFKIMGYWSAGVRNYYGKKPVTNPQDLKGTKIRIQTSPVQQEFWTKLGAIPTQIAWNELYQALQQGTVDASENDYTNLSLKDHHKTGNGKYISKTEHDFTTRFLLMNGNRFNEFTEEQQKWIQEAAKKATEEERNVTLSMLKESEQKILDDGGIINDVNIDEFKKVAIEIQDKFCNDNDMKEYIDVIRNIN